MRFPLQLRIIPYHVLESDPALSSQRTKSYVLMRVRAIGKGFIGEFGGVVGSGVAAEGPDDGIS